MELSRRARLAPAVCALVAVTSGCGGALTPSVLPVGSQGEAKPATVAKWDLLYVSNGSGDVTIYRYWKRAFVRLLTGFKAPKGECVDKGGNVFITDSAAQRIVEYAHGGTKPVAKLADTGYAPYGCSIDPRNGNLAVANRTSKGGYGGIAIYVKAKGNPHYYGPIKYLPNPITLGYDDRGNLLIGSLFVESGYYYASFALLPKGSTSFINVTLQQVVSGSPFEDVTTVQWDGAYWAVVDSGQVLRYTIDDQGNATYIGATPLYGSSFQPNQFWIYRTAVGAEIVGAQSYYSSVVMYWPYPSGGSSIGSITDFLNAPYGVTVSRKTLSDRTQ
jgi:hypothetical protein